MRHTHSERKPASIDDRSDDGLSINRRLDIYNNIQYPARFFLLWECSSGLLPLPDRNGHFFVNTIKRNPWHMVNLLI